jgi:amino acid transporter
VSSSGALGRGAIILFYAFAGVEIALVPGGEIRQPSRTVPLAILLALASTTMVYLAVQFVAQGALGDGLARESQAPLAATAARLIGSTGQWLVIVGSAVSMAGYIAGDALGTPRALFAFARDGVLPSAIGRVHPRFRTPWVAVIVHAAIVCTMAISSTFAELALLTSLATLLLYLLGVAAAFELQRRDIVVEQDDAGSPVAPLRLPAGPLIPALAAAVIVWLVSHATWRELAFQAAVLGVATLVHVVVRKR